MEMVAIETGAHILGTYFRDLIVLVGAFWLAYHVGRKFR